MQDVNCNNWPIRREPSNGESCRTAWCSITRVLARPTIEPLHTTMREVLLLTGLVTLVPLIAAVDHRLLQIRFSEFSLTEVTQELLLVAIASLFALTARRRSDMRVVLILAAGLFATMLMRELDLAFDRIIHGFWVVPALAAASTTFVVAFRERGSILSAWTHYSRTSSYLYVLVALVLLLVFSRTFGSGLMWRPIVGDDLARLVKTVVQEGIELLAYLLAFRGALAVYFDNGEASVRPVEHAGVHRFAHRVRELAEPGRNRF